MVQNIIYSYHIYLCFQTLFLPKFGNKKLHDGTFKGRLFCIVKKEQLCSFIFDLIHLMHGKYNIYIYISSPKKPDERKYGYHIKKPQW
jgi:hypothetical protein